MTPSDQKFESHQQCSVHKVQIQTVKIKCLTMIYTKGTHKHTHALMHGHTHTHTHTHTQT